MSAVCTYEKDTKRKHRYDVQGMGGGITGTLYIDKSAEFTPEKFEIVVVE